MAQSWDATKNDLNDSLAPLTPIAHPTRVSAQFLANYPPSHFSLPSWPHPTPKDTTQT